MGKKSGPPPPDYAALAKQQGQDNRDTAQYNAELNRVNQYTPDGSLVWNSSIGPDGKTVWSQTTTLSPEQQKLYDTQNALSQQYLNTAQSAVDRVAEAMGKPLDMTNIRSPQYFDSKGTSAQVNVPYQDLGASPQFQSVGAAPSLSGVSGQPQFKTQLDFVAGAGMPTAPTLSGASGGSIARSFDTSGVRALPGTIDDASRKRVEEALMSRLNPQYQQDEQALRARLLNSGIEVGTDAYNKEMANFSQRLNDARMQAVLAGGQEESRQVGLQAGLQGQEFDQAYRKGKFGQDADAAMAANSLQAASINNAAQLALYNAQLGAQNQRFTQGMAAANFGNQWGQQGFQNNLAATGFNNDALTQQFQNSLAGAGFNNTVAQQGFDNNLTRAQFGNNAAAQATQQQLQIDQIANAMGQSSAAFNNQTAAQAMQQEAYLRQLPLNEANALRTGGQVQGPQFGSYYTANAAAAPIMDAGIAQGNANAQQAAQNQSGFNAFLGGMANLGGSVLGAKSAPWWLSDPRLKTNVVRVGTHKLGIGIYEYDLQGKRQRGVMSTEVRAVAPHAVMVGEDGFDRVNYSMLE